MFRSCFVLKFSIQRGEGEKREGVQVSKKAHRTFDPRISSTPVLTSRGPSPLFDRHNHNHTTETGDLSESSSLVKYSSPWFSLHLKPGPFDGRSQLYNVHYKRMSVLLRAAQ